MSDAFDTNEETGVFPGDGDENAYADEQTPWAPGQPGLDDRGGFDGTDEAPMPPGLEGADRTAAPPAPGTSSSGEPPEAPVDDPFDPTQTPWAPGQPGAEEAGPTEAPPHPSFTPDGLEGDGLPSEIPPGEGNGHVVIAPMVNVFVELTGQPLSADDFSSRASDLGLADTPEDAAALDPDSAASVLNEFGLTCHVEQGNITIIQNHIAEGAHVVLTVDGLPVADGGDEAGPSTLEVAGVHRAEGVVELAPRGGSTDTRYHMPLRTFEEAWEASDRKMVVAERPGGARSTGHNPSLTHSAGPGPALPATPESHPDPAHAAGGPATTEAAGATREDRDADSPFDLRVVILPIVAAGVAIARRVRGII